MKTIRNTNFQQTCLQWSVIVLLATLGSGRLGADSNSKNPTSKFYVADVSGKSDVNTGEKIEDLNNKSVYSAEGSIIETKKDSTNALVLSNGTGIFIDPDSRLEIKRFLQEPFEPNRTDLETEPSISQTKSYLARGTIGLCTSKLVAGSVMTYSTALADISVRGQKVVIEATDNETKVSLIAGDVTLRGEGFTGGETLEPGNQAIITRQGFNQPPKIVIQPIPDDELPGLEAKVAQACMARRTVYFDIAERQNENSSESDALDLIPITVTPVNPNDIGPVISASALPK